VIDSASPQGTQHSDARFADVLQLPTLREVRRRFPLLIVGLGLLGVSIAASVRAQLGLAPWDVFHQGVSKVTHLSLGAVIVLVGLVVLVVWIPLRQRLGFGTVLNALSVGFIANFGLAVIPVPHHLVVRVALLVAAIAGMALGTGLYIGSGLGPGPRDGLTRRSPLAVIACGPYERRSSSACSSSGSCSAARSVSAPS